MSHQIAYAIADRLPAEILAGDTIQAPAPGGSQHPPERVILIVDGMSFVIPNGTALAYVQMAADSLADACAAVIATVQAETTPAADEQPAKKSRKKSQGTETPAA